MSLDIAILGANGKPAEQVCVGLENYGWLIQFTGKDDCLLKRLNDYHADAEFQNTELDGLIKELSIVRERVHNNKSFLLFIDSFVALVEQARRKQLPLVAIAD